MAMGNNRLLPNHYEAQTTHESFAYFSTRIIVRRIIKPESTQEFIII